MKRDLVCQDGTSNKFWNIETDGKSFTVTFGRIGTAGQTSTKSFPNEAACEKAANALIAEKEKKGYAPAAGGAKPSAAPKKTPAKPAVSGKLADADVTKLMRAIELGHVDKAAALIAKGNIDIQVKQKYGGATTPLYDAVRRSQTKIVKLLLDAGADARKVDENGSLLHAARDVEVAKLLVAAGADIQAINKWKSTPLHDAAQSNNLELVQFLVENGADLEARNKDGKSAYVLGDFKTRKALIKAGAKGPGKTEGRVLKPKVSTAKPESMELWRDGAMAVDPSDGSVWFGGFHSIYRWDGTDLTAFKFDDSSSVSFILPGANGKMYFAFSRGILVKSGDDWLHYNRENSNLHDGHITEMMVDRDGRALIMGYGGEEKVDRPISVFDGTSFEVWEAGNQFPAGLETGCIGVDTKNRLLLGAKTGVTTPDGKVVKKAAGFGAAEPRLIVSTAKETFVADWSNIYRLAPDWSVKETIKHPKGGTSSIVVDGDTLYIGASYGGLLCVKDGEQKHFTEKNSGFRDDDNIKNLALGKDGTLWMSTERSVFQLRGDEIVRFNEKAEKAAPAKSAAEAKPAPAPVKKKKKAKPASALVPKAKLPAHVVKAIESAKLGELDAELLFSLVRPAIGVVLTKEAKVAVGGSKIGGRPDLAAGVKWPVYEDEDDRYLPFFAQVNLADIAKHDIEGLLPKKGRISFFIDTQPDEISDSRVIYDDGSKKAARLEWPEDLVDRKDEDDFVAQISERKIEFYATWTLPSREYFESTVGLELTDADETALSKLEAALHAQDPKKSSTTRLLGWPDTLQGEIVSGPEQIILLQIDASMSGPKDLEQAFRYWGNGIAHFTIRRKDLEAKKLNKASAEVAYT